MPRPFINRSCFLFTVTLTALSTAPFALTLPEGHKLSTSIGTMGLFDDDRLLTGKLDYEFSPLENYWSIRPKLTAFATDTSAYYIAAGGQKDFVINPEFQWHLSFVAGYFHEDKAGNGFDLHYDVEFYSSLSVSYLMNEHSSIRAEIGHISNSSLGDRNPGSESFFLSYVTKF